MADNFNINTTQDQSLIAGGLDPKQPVTSAWDFANSIAQLARTQQTHEQQVAEAAERIKQARLMSGQKATAAEAGYNPELINTMTKDQALASLKLINEAKGLNISDEQMKQWYDTLPDIVSRQEVEAFSTRFMGERTKTGQPAKFTTDQDIAIPEGSTAADLGLIADTENPAVGHVPADGMYQVMYDNQGNLVKVIPGGKEARDNSLALGEKDQQFWSRQFGTRIANKINPYLASSRTQVGVALASYVRCLRALEAVTKTPISKQDAANVIAEIGAVYKGGSPDESMLLATKYDTMYGEFQEWLQSLTGRVRNSLPEDVRKHLVSRITDLERQSKLIIDHAISATEALNADVIEHNQDAWNKFKDVIDRALADPNAAAKVTGMDTTTSEDKLPFNPAPATPLTAPGTTTSAAGPDVHALANALGLKKKVQ
jgi:hypothetical protein